MSRKVVAWMVVVMVWVGMCAMAGCEWAGDVGNMDPTPAPTVPSPQP